MADIRIMLCDVTGTAIQNITSLAVNAKYTEQLSKPTQFSFTVDPSDDRIKALHSDGAPFLEYLRRVIKVYRFEWNPSTQRNEYVLRFAGRIWPLEDSGDEEGQQTTVTAIDSLQMMGYRWARETDGSVKQVTFGTTGGATVAVSDILRGLVDRTNSFAGECGLTTTGGTVNGTIPQVRVRYNYVIMSQVFQEAAAGVDYWCEPVDGDDYVLGRLHIYQQRGQDRPNALFGYNEEPHSVLTMTRTFDPTDVANSIVGLGTGKNQGSYVSAASDSTSIGSYGTFEAFRSFSDVTDQDNLNLLTAAELYKSRPPQEAVTLKPTTALQPFRDFNVGDTIREVAGVDLRGGFPKRSARLYGMTITWNTEGDEDYEVVTSKDQVS